MSPDDHKTISRRALEMLASNHSDRLEDIFTENYVNHQEPDVAGGVSDKNLEAWKALVSDFHQSFSNAQVLVLMQIAEGDLVATHWQFTATHTGDFQGLAPSDKKPTWTGVVIDRFEEGKIVESWVSWDKYRFFKGLGLVK